MSVYINNVIIRNLLQINIQGINLLVLFGSCFFFMYMNIEYSNGVKKLINFYQDLSRLLVKNRVLVMVIIRIMQRLAVDVSYCQ